MPNPFKLIPDSPLEVFFLFANADAFYISARHALLYGWVGVGASNAHRSIELYIKAILKLDYEGERTHDLIDLLKKYKSRDPYFATILGDSHKVEFLKALSDAYLTHRYGEAGSHSNSTEMIALLDELAFNLRKIYLRNLNVPSGKIYMPDKLKEEFLADNKAFGENNLTNRVAAQMGLPVTEESSS